MATGEPYLVFVDTVNRSMSKHQRDSGLKVTTSNLCSEIMLHTGLDHKEKKGPLFVVYLQSIWKNGKNGTHRVNLLKI